MTYHTILHIPHQPAPDYGGLDGRFANLRSDGFDRYERLLHTAAIVRGAVAGLTLGLVFA